MTSEPKRGRGAFDGWSKSSLKSLLEGCSWQWALQRIGGLEGGSSPHSAAGTGLHAAIEWHELSRIDGANIPDKSSLIYEAYQNGYDDGQNIPTNLEAYHGGADLAARWAAELTDTWYESDVRETLLTYTPIAVEPHVETNNVPVASSLRGYLDWFGRDGDGVATVVDYKSASDLKRWNNPDHHLIESSVYLYLAMAGGLVEDEPVRMEWHIVSRKGQTGILAGPTFTPDVMEFVFARVSEAQAIMDSAGYKPNPSWSLCSERWCNFYHGCQTSGILGPDHISFDSPEPAPLRAGRGAGEVERSPLSAAAPSPAQPNV
jgi:hypothetical protein